MTPEDLLKLQVQEFNKGNVSFLMTLYENDACFASEPGGGHIGMAQRYHVCTIFVVDNIPNQIGYLIVIDGGNGQVLYISHGQPIGISGHSSMFVYLSSGHGYGGWDRW